MVLVTFRFIGLAHLHTLWGCLVFLGFPSGFGLVCLGLCPLGFLWLVFRRAVCTFGVVWAPWPPDAMESFVPVGPLPSVFMACFRGCCCGCPLALRCLFGGSSDQSSHTHNCILSRGVFCHSAIKAAERDHESCRKWPDCCFPVLCRGKIGWFWWCWFAAKEMVIHSLLQTKKDFKELVSNLFFRIDDLGLGMITIAEFEKHFNDEALLHWSPDPSSWPKRHASRLLPSEKTAIPTPIRINPWQLCGTQRNWGSSSGFLWVAWDGCSRCVDPLCESGCRWWQCYQCLDMQYMQCSQKYLKTLKGMKLLKSFCGLSRFVWPHPLHKFTLREWTDSIWPDFPPWLSQSWANAIRPMISGWRRNLFSLK